MKNYYTILGVTPDSTDAEIKSAYRILARKYHPDINPDGTDRFKDISEAYETLSNRQKRLKYDTINGFFKSDKTQKTSQEKQNSQKQNNRENPKSNKKDFSKKIDDIFEFLNKKQQKISPQRGKDLYEDIYITLEEAINGTEKIVNIVHTTSCPHCKGRKFINGSKCQSCNGTGENSIHKKINVKIPENIKNGTKLRIAKEGTDGENGGENGDLYLTVKIQKSSNIEYEDKNILYKIPIAPYEAVLGGNIKIPSNDGFINLKIPPKTSNGQKFRLANQGKEVNGSKGDIIVTVYIEIPSSLSDDEIKLYEKLKKLSSKNIRENI